MQHISFELLRFTKEAVALARGERIIYCNPAACELLNGDIEGQSLSDVLGPELTGVQAGSYVGTALVRGRQLLLRVVRQEEIQAIFFEQPRTEKDLLNDAFIYSLRESMMTGDMAADICRNRVDELEDRELSSALATLNQSQFRIKRLVSNMTMVHHFLKNEMVFEPMEMDLALFVRQYADTLRCLRPDIDIVSGGSYSLRAQIDPAQVEHLVSNLISNCLLHAKGCSRISINVMDCGDIALLSISDDGCGMESEQLRWAFERYRHIYGMSELGGGAGMGLTVARAVAEKHSGTLLLESRPGYGTTVRVSFRKKLCGEGRLRCGEDCYGGEIKSLLLGLAGCLDDRFYMERYMD